MALALPLKPINTGRHAKNMEASTDTRHGLRAKFQRFVGRKAVAESVRAVPEQVSNSAPRHRAHTQLFTSREVSALPAPHNPKHAAERLSIRKQLMESALAKVAIRREIAPIDTVAPTPTAVVEEPSQPAAKTAGGLLKRSRATNPDKVKEQFSHDSLTPNAQLADVEATLVAPGEPAKVINTAPSGLPQRQRAINLRGVVARFSQEAFSGRDDIPVEPGLAPASVTTLVQTEAEPVAGIPTESEPGAHRGQPQYESTESLAETHVGRHRPA